jgi:outer membrane immunogenic protein
MVLKAPPAPAYSAPGYNWTGFYIGGNFGGGWGNESYSLTGTNALGTLVGGGSADPSGVYGGGQIGVNYEFPSHWVVGIEADGDWSNISGSTSGCGTYTTGVDAGLPSGCSTSNSKLQDFGTVRGRLGYAWNNVLLYGTGGWAWGNASSTSALNCIGTACPATSLPFTGGTSSYSNTLSGWAAGAGLEWGFLPHWTARVEYLHLEFDDVVSSYSATELIAIPGVGPTTSTTMYGARSNTGIDTVRVGLNYLFNY